MEVGGLPLIPRQSQGGLWPQPEAEKGELTPVGLIFSCLFKGWETLKLLLLVLHPALQPWEAGWMMEETEASTPLVRLWLLSSGAGVW